MSVSPEQRHKKSRPCRICGGGGDDPRGQERRCSGFISADEEYEHCSREELAVGLEMEEGGTYAHRMHGPCRCGQTHGDARSTTRLKREPIAEYNYVNENGQLLFQVVRFPPKEFRQRRPDGGGDWIWQLGDTPRVPYRLPELLASGDRAVYVVEGEKDVEALRAIGYVATCNPGGAGKWSTVAEVARKALHGRDVIVVADTDAVGRTHAAAVAKSLEGIASHVRIVEPPAPHKDVSDMLAAGLPLRFDAAPGPPAEDSRWNILGVSDLSEDLPPIPWLCESVGLAPGAVSLFAGYGYSRKTMALQAAAMSVASGQRLWGLFGVRQGKALHLDYEQGRRITQERYQRLARGMGLELRDLEPGALRVASMPRIYLDEQEASDELLRLCEGATFVLVDSLRAAFPHADENSSEVRSYLDVLNRVSERTHATIAVIHHARKPSKDAADGATFAIRGSSALFDACQSVYVFEGAKDTATTVHHQKDRIRGATCEEFGLTGEDVERDGNRRWGLRVVHLEQRQIAEAAEAVQKAKDSVAVERVTGAVTDLLKRHAGVFRGSKESLRLAAGIKIRHQTFLSIVDQMVTSGVVFEVGGHKSKELRLTGAS